MTRLKRNNTYTKEQMIEKKLEDKGHKFLFGELN